VITLAGSFGIIPARIAVLIFDPTSGADSIELFAITYLIIN